MTEYLCYYQLHVDDRTFNIHCVVEANSASEALATLRSYTGKNYHLQAKGVSLNGEGVYDSRLKKYLEDPGKWDPITQKMRE